MLALASMVVMFMLDAASKHLVRSMRTASHHLVPGLRLTHVDSRRAEFSHGRGRAGLVLSWLIAFACVVVLIGTDRALHSPLAQIGAGAALGGALGNLLDVLRRRAITDFVDLGWWPVFNIADVGIVTGLILVLMPMV